METSSPFQGNIPGAPPPPPEVKVRTMRSDLESMARSGGGAPRFENVAVAGLAMENDATQQSSVAGGVTESAASGSSKSLVGVIFVVIVALIAIAAVGYVAYTVFYPSTG